MSLLGVTSHRAPVTPFWAPSVEQVTTIDARSVNTLASLTSASPYNVITLTFIAPSAGLLVGTASVNFLNTASTSGLYTAQLTDVVSGGTCSHLVSLPAGNTTAQYGVATPMLSLGLSAGQSVTYRLVVTASNGTSTPPPQYEWSWSVLFYPTI